MATGGMPTSKRVYYYRLQALLIGGGTAVIRTVFDQRIGVPLTAHLSKNRTTIDTLLKTSAISREQYIKLCSGNVTSADFDITLLTCLLQRTCGLKGSLNAVWREMPAPSDTSIEADVVRLRRLRNELVHRGTVVMSEKGFYTKWSELETVLLRLNGLGQNPVQNLKQSIEQVKHAVVDEEMEKHYDQILGSWERVDKAITDELGEMSQALPQGSSQSKEMKRGLTDAHDEMLGMPQEKTPRLESLKAMSERYFLEAEKSKELFVKTSAYRKACEKLSKTGIVILSGYPGEGKTTVGKQLLLDISPAQKILKLTGAQDWKNINRTDWNAIFIDDIFGSKMLDEVTVDRWRKYLYEVESAARQLHMNVVITARDDVLKSAKEFFKLDLFKDENVTVLSSSDLTDEEKRNILKLHLNNKNRKMSSIELNQCVERWNNDQSNVGFPECAVIFAEDDGVFRKGSGFFEKPFELLRKCLSDIFKHEEKYFNVLILIWTIRSKTVSKFDLEPNKLQVFKDIEEALGYPPQWKSNILQEGLDHFNGGFLTKDSTTGEYTFSHNFISDIVGLVAGEKYPDVIIRYGSKKFIMEYLKTANNSNTKDCLVVDRRMYPVLCKRLNGLLFKEKQWLWCDNVGPGGRVSITGVENMLIASSKPDLSILAHEAFADKVFIKNFVDPQNVTDAISTPVLEVTEHFRNTYCIVFENRKMSMCLPAFFLAKQNGTMVEECIAHNLLSEQEKFIALLLATQYQETSLVEKLLLAGAPVNEDSLQIASVNRDLVLLKLLLGHFKKDTGYEHIQNGNTPLMTAAKRGYIDVVRFWLQAGVDVNYKNKDGSSAFDKALVGNHPEVCSALIEKGCEINVKNGKFQRTPLHKAADMGFVNMTKLLLNAGASADIQDRRGEYPIHSAAIHGHTEIVELLLEKDKSLGVKPFNYRGTVRFKQFSLYHFAVWKEDMGLLHVLKKFQIDPNLQDNYGRTPVYLAAFYNKPAFVESLLYVADVTKTDRNGYTTLHAAAYKMNPELIETLCSFYSNIRIVDRRGNSVFHALINGAEMAMKDPYRYPSEIREKVSNCVKKLLMKDPGFQEALKEMKNQMGQKVLIKVDQSIYSLMYAY